MCLIFYLVFTGLISNEEKVEGRVVFRNESWFELFNNDLRKSMEIVVRRKVTAV